MGPVDAVGVQHVAASQLLLSDHSRICAATFLFFFAGAEKLKAFRCEV